MQDALCNLNLPRVVVENLTIIDLRGREELMVQYITDTNSTIGIGMFVTEKFRFYRDGEQHFTTHLTGFNRIAIDFPCEGSWMAPG